MALHGSSAAISVWMDGVCVCVRVSVSVCACARVCA